MGPLPMWQMLRDRCLLKWRRGEVAKWRISMISTVWVMSSLWLFSHLEVVYGVHHQVCAEGSFTVPQSGVGDGVGWFIKVHVHVHTSSASTSHLVILDDTSRIRWWGSNIYVHGHTSSTLISHLVLLNDTSGVRWGWVGWGMNVYVHLRTSSTLTSHLVILDDMSGVRWRWVGVGW